MSIAEVRSLPLREKFQILEAIWEDLSARIDGMSVSLADQVLLDERIQRVRNGVVEVHDWVWSSFPSDGHNSGAHFRRCTG